MALLNCPVCGAVLETEQSRAMPFCSPRCKQIDLGRWLDEKQRVPHVDLNADEEVEPEPTE